MPTLINVLLIIVITTLTIALIVNEATLEAERLRKIDKVRDDNQNYNDVLDDFDYKYQSNGGDPLFLYGDNDGS